MFPVGKRNGENAAFQSLMLLLMCPLFPPYCPDLNFSKRSRSFNQSTWLEVSLCSTRWNITLPCQTKLPPCRKCLTFFCPIPKVRMKGAKAGGQHTIPWWPIYVASCSQMGCANPASSFWPNEIIREGWWHKAFPVLSPLPKKLGLLAHTISCGLHQSIFPKETNLDGQGPG